MDTQQEPQHRAAQRRCHRSLPLTVSALDIPSLRPPTPSYCTTPTGTRSWTCRYEYSLGGRPCCFAHSACLCALLNSSHVNNGTKQKCITRLPTPIVSPPAGPGALPPHRPDARGARVPAADGGQRRGAHRARGGGEAQVRRQLHHRCVTSTQTLSQRTFSRRASCTQSAR